jgi:hypothetical protein
MVSIDTLVSIGATSAASLERFVATRDTLALFSANRYERPIAYSRGAVHPRVMESAAKKGGHGERAPPRRQCGARIDVDGTSSRRGNTGTLQGGVDSRDSEPDRKLDRR